MKVPALACLYHSSSCWLDFKYSIILKYLYRLYPASPVLTLTIDSQMKIFCVSQHCLVFIGRYQAQFFAFQSTEFVILRDGVGRQSDVRINKTKLEIETFNNDPF